MLRLLVVERGGENVGVGGEGEVGEYDEVVIGGSGW